MALFGFFRYRGVAALSVIAMMILGLIAIYALLGSDDGNDTAEDQTTTDPAPPQSVEGELVIEDSEFPLTLQCRAGTDADNTDEDSSTGRDPSTGRDEVYVVVITNRGEVESDLLITADLSNGDGVTVGAVATIDRLRPDQTRPAVLFADRDIGIIESCKITAVQGDKRVLLRS